MVEGRNSSTGMNERTLFILVVLSQMKRWVIFRVCEKKEREYYLLDKKGRLQSGR